MISAPSTSSACHRFAAESGFPVSGGHLELQHEQRQRNGDDTVGQCQQPVDPWHVVVVGGGRHWQELGRPRPPERVMVAIGAGNVLPGPLLPPARPAQGGASGSPA